MAKKGQAVQLQTEVSSDDEWEKLLQRDGLIVVDVYSDWCGPCQGMAANLKKLKLEIGGDMLQLAMAKNDNISALERFRGKSEPTWMFISRGKMANLMFGADAPKLTRLIVDELKVEQQVTSGERQREGLLEVTERSPEEQVRFEAVESVRLAAERKEEARKAKEFHERKVAECENILENLPGFGVILVFPCAKDAYQEVLNELINEAGLAVSQTEKVTVTEEDLHQLFYFAESDDDRIDDASVEELLEGGLSRWLLIKNRHNVDDFLGTILRIVYGEEMRAPGAPDSSYQKLAMTVEEEDTHETKQVMGVWAPTNELMVATALRLFFPKLTKPYELPEPEPTPPYMTVVFDHSKLHAIAPLMSQYKSEVMHYGFFTSEVPEEARLVAKSLRRLEEDGAKRTFDEKLVIQLSKRSSECMLAFVQTEPVYVSPNPEEGARECEIFFPEDYAESLLSEDLEYENVVSEVKLTAAAVEEFDYFCESKLSESSVAELTTPPGKVSLGLLMKRTSEHLTGDIDEVVLQAVYGNSRRPPGDERSPSRRLLRKLNVAEEADDPGALAGLWAPPNRLAKAMALKSLFQSLTGPYRLAEYVATPLYVAVGYDAFKTRDVMEVVAKYPDQVLAYGFFTSDIPPEAKLIAKTVEEFEERSVPATYEEKLLLQLAKTDPECWMSFCELGPTYMSADCDAGEVDCSYLFPPGYSRRGEREVHEVKKKTKRRGGGRSKGAASAAHTSAVAAASVAHEETTSLATSDLNKEQSELDHEEVGEIESDEGADEGAAAPGEDKATSPIGDVE